MTPQLTVVIVNYNVKDLIQNCLSSIYKYCGNIALELIVIDNASTDGSVVMIQNKFPACILISNKTNAGFSEANNQGIRIAKGDFILLLNPDTELRNDSISGMMTYLNKHPSIAMLAPKLLNTDGSLQISCCKFPSVLNIIVEALYLHILFKLRQYPLSNFDTIFDVDYAAGACLLFHKDLINKIGYLDTNLFWMDDVDYCYRAKTVGSVVYFPQSKIIHHSGKSLRQNYNISISNQIISKLKYLRKHFSFITFLVGIIFSLIHVFTRIMIFTVLSPFKKVYFSKSKAYIYTLSKMVSYLTFNNQSVN